MKERAFHLHDGRSGAAITVRVNPRASRNEISEILEDGTVKIRLKTPSNTETANQELIRFLAEVLDTQAEQIEIIAGESGNDKLVTIMNLDGDTVQARILQYIS